MIACRTRGPQSTFNGAPIPIPRIRGSLPFFVHLASRQIEFFHTEDTGQIQRIAVCRSRIGIRPNTITLITLITCTAIVICSAIFVALRQFAVMDTHFHSHLAFLFLLLFTLSTSVNPNPGKKMRNLDCVYQPTYYRYLQVVNGLKES